MHETLLFITLCLKKLKCAVSLLISSGFDQRHVWLVWLNFFVDLLSERKRHVFATRSDPLDLSRRMSNAECAQRSAIMRRPAGRWSRRLPGLYTVDPTGLSKWRLSVLRTFRATAVDHWSAIEYRWASFPGARDALVQIHRVYTPAWIFTWTGWTWLFSRTRAESQNTHFDPIAFALYWLYLFLIF